MANNLEEFWVVHRPRHPIWGSVMFAATTTKPVAPPIANLAVNLYDGDEKDYLFYKYSSASLSYPAMYAVTERPWLTHTVTHSMQDAIVAAKRLVPFVGQDNIRIVKVISGKLNITY